MARGSEQSELTEFCTFAVDRGHYRQKDESDADFLRRVIRLAIPTMHRAMAIDHAGPKIQLHVALDTAIKVADEAREEWDKAPGGMKAGKLLIALSGNLPGYREDIDAIHNALANSDALNG